MTTRVLHRFGKIGAALGCAFLLCAAAPPAEMPQRAQVPQRGDISQRTGIAATVNDDAITFSDIRNRLNLYLAGNPQQPPPDVRHKLELQVLDKLIDEKLQMQEAKKEGITVSDDDLAQGLEQIAKQNHMTLGQFKDKLNSSGVKMSTLNEQLRAEIAWSQLVRRKLRPDVAVSESEIDSALEQQAHARGREEFLVAEILLPVPSKEMEDTVRHDGEKIVEALKHGGSFQQAARQFSKAPGAAQGGDLGWVREGTLDDKLDAALKTMHPGQISAPIRTDKGYDILFLRDVHEPGAAASAPAPQPEAAPQQQAAAPAPAPAAATPPETILHLKQITIPIDPSDPAPVVAAKMNRAQSLRSEISSCEQMDKKSKDFVAPGTTDMGRGPLSALPEPVRRAVETLPVGMVSVPVRGDNGVAVLMVCERTEVPGHATSAAPAPAPARPPVQAAAPAPHPAAGPGAHPADPSREQVANQIGMKRLDQMQEHYLRDLRATAFIDKRL